MGKDMNCHKILSPVFASAVCLVIGTAGADIYVDGSFEGVPAGTLESPYTTIAAGCAAAYPGDRILVRGGQEYFFSATTMDAATLSVASVRLLGCDTDWNPIADCQATDKMPVVSISDSFDLELRTPFSVSGTGNVISGFQVQFSGAIFKGRDQKGLISLALGAENTVIEDCVFHLSGSDSEATGGKMNGIVFCEKGVKDGPHARNTLIRGCHFKMPKPCVSVCAFYNLHEGTRFEENLVTGLGKLFDGKIGFGGVDFHIVSNVFVNCSNGTTQQYGSWLLDSNGYPSPESGEIAYNRFVRDDFGDAFRYSLIQHSRQDNGCWKQVMFHHNTIVGYDVVFDSPGTNGTDVAGAMWQPQIFDNLIVGVGSVLSESANGKWKKGGTEYASSFLPGSTFQGNVVQCDGELNTGSAKSQGWYSLANLAGWDTKKIITADPTFINTTDPTSQNYYRLRVKDDPWVVDSALDDSSYPHFVGAVAPVSRGFAVRIR